MGANVGAKKLILLMILVLLLNNAFAQNPEDLTASEGGVLEGQNPLVIQGQEQIKQTAAIQVKLDEMREENVRNIEAAVGYMFAQMQQIQTTLIIIMVLTGLGILGLWWGIFLHFKSRRLL